MFKQGDWVIHDRKIGKIKSIREEGFASFTDGYFETSGRILDDCRPLTLESKVAAENFDYYYRELRKIDGSGGLNYPDINRHFSALCLKAIDCPDDWKSIQDEAIAFIREARDYRPVIQGVKLFGRAAR